MNFRAPLCLFFVTALERSESVTTLSSGSNAASP
jgi:hypothetical protein